MSLFQLQFDSRPQISEIRKIKIHNTDLEIKSFRHPQQTRLDLHKNIQYLKCSFNRYLQENRERKQLLIIKANYIQLLCTDVFNRKQVCF